MARDSQESIFSKFTLLFINIDFFMIVNFVLKWHFNSLKLATCQGNIGLSNLQLGPQHGATLDAIYCRQFAFIRLFIFLNFKQSSGN